MKTPKTSTGGAQCPVCDGKGKAVQPITLESLVDAEVRRNLSTTEGFRFCPNPACHVAYFHAGTGQTIHKDQVAVRIGQKETDLSRPVCYCFGYTAEDVRDEVAGTGDSTIFDEISEKCRQGLDRCAETNPQGSCCLSNVRAVVKEAQARLGVSTQANTLEPVACCPASPADPAATSPQGRSAPTGLWTTGGAVVLATLASACCWVPLLLISLGVSAAGVAGFFEAYRPYFLGATAVLLAAGFYFVFRKPRCAPGSACATPYPKLQRFNKALLGFATVVVLTFALFPNYLGFFLDGASPASAAGLQPGPLGEGGTSTAGLTSYTVQLEIDGMTCTVCATGLASHLNSQPGVRRATVDYDAKSASVELDSASGIDVVLKSISEYGFQGKVRQMQ